jgi:hypothetical protein
VSKNKNSDLKEEVHKRSRTITKEEKTEVAATTIEIGRMKRVYMNERGVGSYLYLRWVG